MNVTMLIAEYLIIGLQVVVFLTLFILKIEHISIRTFHASQGNSLFYSQFSVLIGAIILGFAYMLLHLLPG
jgi:hypothetical protein